MDHFKITEPDGGLLAEGGTHKSVYELIEEYTELGICGVGDHVIINSFEEYVITPNGLVSWVW